MLRYKGITFGPKNLSKRIPQLLNLFKHRICTFFRYLIWDYQQLINKNLDLKRFFGDKMEQECG
jgi:hypothetical protein